MGRHRIIIVAMFEQFIEEESFAAAVPLAFQRFTEATKSVGMSPDYVVTLRPNDQALREAIERALDKAAYEAS